MLKTLGGIKKYIQLNFDNTVLLDLLTIVFNIYTHELLLISLIICVAKYTVHMSRNNKCICQFCYCMKLI